MSLFINLFLFEVFLLFSLEMFEFAENISLSLGTLLLIKNMFRSFIDFVCVMMWFKLLYMSGI